MNIQAIIEMAEMDALIARNQQYDFTSALENPEKHSPIPIPLLRGYIEVHNLGNSDIAWAARVCQNSENHAIKFTIWDVELVCFLRIYWEILIGIRKASILELPDLPTTNENGLGWVKWSMD